MSRVQRWRVMVPVVGAVALYTTPAGLGAQERVRRLLSHTAGLTDEGSSNGPHDPSALAAAFAAGDQNACLGRRTSRRWR